MVALPSSGPLMRFVLLAAPLLPAASAVAQPLEDCPRYSLQTLTSWMQSPETRIAAYGHTCRAINLDQLLSQQAREGFTPADPLYWTESYRSQIGIIDRAMTVNRAWAGPDAVRNLGMLNRLYLKYRKLGAAPGQEL